MKDVRRIKSVEVFDKRGRRLKKKRLFELVNDSIILIPVPPPKAQVKVTFYRTPKELDEAQ